MFYLTGRDDFATYAHSSKCIYYILCGAWVPDATIQGCYEPFQYHLKGDHRAMVVDFDTNLLFGNPTATLTTPAQREFSFKDAGSNQKYIQARHEYLTQHHFASRLTQLQEVWDPDLAEQLHTHKHTHKTLHISTYYYACQQKNMSHPPQEGSNRSWLIAHLWVSYG